MMDFDYGAAWAQGYAAPSCRDGEQLNAIHLPDAPIIKEVVARGGRGPKARYRSRRFRARSRSRSLTAANTSIMSR